MDFDSLPDDTAAVAPTSTPTPVSTNATTQPSFDDLTDDSETYGTPTEIAKTALEGVGKGVAGPLFTGAETALLGNAEEQKAREETNPVTHGAGELAGLVGGSLLAPEVTLGGKLGQIGEAAEAASGLGRLGSAVVKGAVENVAYQAQDEISKLILTPTDPATAAESAVADMGIAALIGGGFGTLSPLWHATEAPKLGGVLGAVADKLGGIEGQENTVKAAFDKLGVPIEPGVAALADNTPEIQQVARTLSQTDNAPGLSYQKDIDAAYKKAGDFMAEQLGKTPEAVSDSTPASKYDVGNEIARTLAEERKPSMEPIEKGYAEMRKMIKNVELTPSFVDKVEDTVKEQSKLQSTLDKATRAAIKAQKSGDPEIAIETAAKAQDAANALKAADTAAKTPGTIDKISDAIAQKAIDEKWATMPSSDIMKLVNTTLKELPLQKDVASLEGYIQQVGNAANADPLNKPLKRAGAILTGIMRDAQDSLIGNKLGSEYGAEAIDAFKANREAFKAQAALRNEIEDRLGLGATTSGYNKALIEEGRTNGEAVLRKLSGKNDAAWLAFVQKNYPKTAEVIRNYHIDELIHNSRDGKDIDTGKFLRNFNNKNVSPELRAFMAPGESANKINAMGAALEGLKNPNKNFSNTARTVSSLGKDVAATGVAAVLGATGHGFVKSAIAGTLTKILGDVPDAIRLAYLRFLGSDKPINPGAFKNLVDYVQAVKKGDTLLNNAAKAVFKAGSQVIPAHMMPNDKDRNKIDKSVDNYTDHPDKMISMTGQTGHYLPDHATAISQTGATAVKYIKENRPNTAPQSPLDSERKMTVVEKANYNRKMDIIQQPAIVMKHIAEGTLTPDDVNTLKAVYPALYNRISDKLSNEMVNAKSKGTTIPYRTRTMLSLYLGQAMDSSLLPANIMAAQPQSPMSQPQTPMQPASNPKRSVAAINKMPNLYKTQGQSAEEDRAKR